MHETGARNGRVAVRSGLGASVFSSLFLVVMLLRFQANEATAWSSEPRDAQASFADSVRQYQTKTKAASGLQPARGRLNRALPCHTRYTADAGRKELEGARAALVKICFSSASLVVQTGWLRSAPAGATRMPSAVSKSFLPIALSCHAGTSEKRCRR